MFFFSRLTKAQSKKLGDQISLKKVYSPETLADYQLK